MSRTDEVVVAARRAASKAFNDAVSNARGVREAAAAVGRAGGTVLVKKIAKCCSDGFIAYAAAARDKIISLDSPNSAEYRSVYSGILDDGVSQFMGIFRQHAVPAPLSMSIPDTELNGLMLDLRQIAMDAVKDFELETSKPIPSDEMNLSEGELTRIILAEFARSGKSNKFNVLGRPYQRGALEQRLERNLTAEERALAGRCVEKMLQKGLLSATCDDAVAPTDWLDITDLGREALEHGAVDRLDRILNKIRPSLSGIRHGAWAAATSGDPEAARQAAHSVRELISQVLDALAPIEELKAQPGFKASSESASGVTRKMRLEYISKQRRDRLSDSDRAIIADSERLLNSLYSKFSGIAHLRGTADRHEVRAYLEITEVLLNLILPEDG